MCVAKTNEGAGDLVPISEASPTNEARRVSVEDGGLTAPEGVDPREPPPRFPSLQFQRGHIR
jgi:hypothetical protein